MMRFVVAGSHRLGGMGRVHSRDRTDTDWAITFDYLGRIRVC